MRSAKQLIAALLAICLGLGLCACGQESTPTTAPTETTAPSNTTVPSTAPSTAPTTVPTETTVPPTEPHPDADTLYAAAYNSIYGLTELVLEYDYAKNRTVDSESFTEKRTGTASYDGLNTASLEALIEEAFSCGGYSTQYYESYLNGAAWSRVNNSNFRCNMTSSAFLARQIPALLMQPELYATVIAEETDTGYTLFFRNAYGLESWTANADQATNAVADGTMRLDASGKLLGCSYHAEYTIGETAYSLDVSVSVIQTENTDFHTRQPVYPDSTPVIGNLEIPKYLLRTVGYVYGTENLSVQYQDTVSGEAFKQTRTQSHSYNLFGVGESFMAQAISQVSLTDYAGNTTYNSQTRTFRDGLYSSCINNGETTTDPTVTDEQLRISLEDSILSALMMPAYIAGAQLTDDGQYLIISFTGNTALVDALCGSIYGLFNTDLDALAQSASTQYMTGYLTIDKASGLPVAMGMSLSRTHKINNVTYLLTYQLDETLTFSAAAAYESITGLPFVTE